MSKTLTEKDYRDAADALGCEVAAIKAVAEVESVKGGFDRDGRIILRFEAHRFKKYTRSKYDKSHPHLSHGYYAGQPGGRALFSEAFELDQTAALLSTSWGKFQMMGDECWRAGFGTEERPDVHAFVEAMKTGERAQLDAFVRFVKSKRLDDNIRNRDWAGFALGYNGSGYKANRYDTKMAAAYKKYSRTKFPAIPDSAAPATAEPTPVPEEVSTPLPTDPPEPATSAAEQPSLPPVEDTPQGQQAPTVAPPEPEPGVFQSAGKVVVEAARSDTIKEKAGAWLAGGGFLAVLNFISNPYVILALAVVTAAVIWRQTEMQKIKKAQAHDITTLTAQINTDRSRPDVEIVK